MVIHKVVTKISHGFIFLDKKLRQVLYRLPFASKTWSNQLDMLLSVI